VRQFGQLPRKIQLNFNITPRTWIWRP